MFLISFYLCFTVPRAGLKERLCPSLFYQFAVGLLSFYLPRDHSASLRFSEDVLPRVSLDSACSQEGDPFVTPSRTRTFHFCFNVHFTFVISDLEHILYVYNFCIICEVLF